MIALKWIYACSLLVAYAVFCCIFLWQHRQRQANLQAQVCAFLDQPTESTHSVLAYASQTGQAQELAFQTARFLHDAGHASVRLVLLGDLTCEDLQQCTRLFCIASTYGEGDPPDSAVHFISRVMRNEQLNLDHLEFAVLALGDRSYQHFCGFGHAIYRWLQARGARSMFGLVEVDNNDGAAIGLWQRQLRNLVGVDAHWQTDELQPWQLRNRRHLNPGSLGGPVYHIELVPCEGLALPVWQAGDLVQLEVPDSSGAFRDYSIASIPSEGAVHLLVRLIRRADGSPGLASHWLTQLASGQDQIQMRIRPHPAFRIGSNAGKPLILIGNGTGLSGLRAHMQARFVSANRVAGLDAAPTWLIFGERNAHCDAHYRQEIDAWSKQGLLNRMDWVFSREQAQQRYVQHVLSDSAGLLKEWVDNGASIYVCGSLKGMAAEVDSCLARILGDHVVQLLSESGRYRRDVY